MQHHCNDEQFTPHDADADDTPRSAVLSAEKRAFSYIGAPYTAAQFAA